MVKTIDLSDYTIYVGPANETVITYLNKNTYSKIFVLVDENTEKWCLPVLESYLDNIPFEIVRCTSGELNKNISTCQEIWQSLMELKADRKSLLINLGGGVIGDMGGFCASTFKRGFSFIQIPTTLLAQVDASIGGKLGIDFAGIKNSIGLFQNPGAVFVDPHFLKTLSGREIRSGFAEIIKHSLINDKKQWEQIEQISKIDQVDWFSTIYSSLLIKQRIVKIDPFEKGLRKALNFGHTIGHAVESDFLESESPLLHGEAIAIGMICEAYLSSKLTNLSVAALESITRFLVHQYGSVQLPESSFDHLLALMQNDKKNENGIINFSCIGPIGEVHINQACSNDLIIESLKYYNTLS